MKLFTNLLGDKRIRIRFNHLLATHTVTLDHHDILFSGSKDKCLDFVGGQLDAILASRQ
ncbi:MAG: hypothetical protein R8G66_33480 [Cytophagales bacterium]|nr:hypothetical protein [Cytophagales bacterium]